jgi:hypothetical protein
MTIPAAVRNKNPGAMEPGFASKRMGSTSFEKLRWTDAKGKTRTNKCATFPTHQHGAAAMFILLSEGKYYRGKPIEDAIRTWCGGYWASDYIDHMCQATGLKPTSLLTAERVQDPDIAVPIARAIARWERGSYAEQLTEDEWIKSHGMAFGGAVAPEPTPDNDVPFQTPEGKDREALEAAAKVAVPVAVGVTGTAVSVPTIPVPPDLTPVSSWKMFGDQIGSIVSWGWGNPYLVGGCLAVLVSVWAGPSLIKRFS